MKDTLKKLIMSDYIQKDHLYFSFSTMKAPNTKLFNNLHLKENEQNVSFTLILNNNTNLIKLIEYYNLNEKITKMSMSHNYTFRKFTSILKLLILQNLIKSIKINKHYEILDLFTLVNYVIKLD